MGCIWGNPFIIGVVCSYVFVRAVMVRHFYYGGKDTIMSILIAVFGGMIWCVTVYLILKILGFCARNDDWEE